MIEDFTYTGKVVKNPKKIFNPNRTIHSLDASKATGPDGIPAIVLKMCSPELSPILAKLFNMCFTVSVFPSSWKVASVLNLLIIALLDCFP